MPKQEIILANLSIRSLLMGCYAISLTLSNVQVWPNWSLPFFTAFALLGYKLFDVLQKPKFLCLAPESLLFGVLFLYMIVFELYLHSNSINNGYFISLGLNITMLLLLVDEFYRNSYVRENAMRLYSAATVAIGFLVWLNIMTTISPSGRLTFMMQNENEFAAALLIAYVYLSIQFIRIEFVSLFSFIKIVYLASFFLILNALVATGTRFTFISVVLVIVLIVIFSLISRHKIQNSLIYSSFCAVFIIFSTNILVPKVILISDSQNFNNVLTDRLSPNIEGNNLADLGGRTPIWHNAVDAIIQSPFGLGYSNYHEFLLARGNPLVHPHNLLLEIGAIAGIIGIMLLFVIGTIISWRAFRVDNRNNFQEFCIWLVPVFFISMSLNVYHLKIFWIALAYLITINYKKHNM